MINLNRKGEKKRATKIHFIINQKKHNNMNDYIGKKVLVRSYDAGVYFGTLEQIDGEQCKLRDVRNIWHWTGATCLSQIANDGITGDKVGPVVSSMVINRCCQIIPLTDKAVANLEGQPVWRQ